MEDPYGLEWPKANTQAYIRLTKLCVHSLHEWSVSHQSLTAFWASMWSLAWVFSLKKGNCAGGEIRPNGNGFTQHLGTAGLFVHTVWCDQSVLHEWDTIKINTSSHQAYRGGEGWLDTERKQRWVYGVRSYFPEGCGTIEFLLSVEPGRRVWPCGWSQEIRGEWGQRASVLKNWNITALEMQSFTWESLGPLWFNERSILDASRFYTWRLVCVFFKVENKNKIK